MLSDEEKKKLAAEVVAEVLNAPLTAEHLALVCRECGRLLPAHEHEGEAELGRLA